MTDPPQLFSPISIHIPRVGDDTSSWYATPVDWLFQSTSPVWGMTRPGRKCEGFLVISIHIPRVGDDRYNRLTVVRIVEFQSTSPVWGMT